MADLATISFLVGPAPDDPTGPVQVTPIVDGRSLIERVGGFEQSRGFSPAGGYAGLVPAHFRFGDLPRYYLGFEPRQWPQPGFAWLLGCDCGEVGCWPLTARVDATEQTVTWTSFSQEHRPHWDYSGFGPFVFDRAAYDAAVRAAVTEIEAANR